MKKKLTKTFIEQIEPADKVRLVGDTMVPGLYLKVTPKGSKSFFLQYGPKRSKKKITDWPGVHTSLEQIRQSARDYLLEYQRTGTIEDPTKFDQDAMAFVDLIQNYIDTRRKTPSSKQSCQRQLDGRITDKLGRLKWTDLSPPMFFEWRDQLSCNRSTWNNLRSIMISAWTFSQERGDIPWERPCPVKLTKRYNIQTRKQIVPDEAYAQFGAIIHEMIAAGEGNIYEHHAILLVMVTGMRNRECMALRKDQVDFSHKTITFQPDQHKTGHDTGVKVINLSDAAMMILKRVLEIQAEEGRDEAEHFFLSNCTAHMRRDPHKPLTRMFWTWNMVKQRAGYPGLIVHNFRAGLISYANRVGLTLSDAAGLVGHADTNTTSKYYMTPSSDKYDAVGNGIGSMIGVYPGPESTEDGPV
ncbi:tyrosine-type recombinase/integrase [Magnetovibrio sp. PR-2]|uniref:tyrosine-type recombinase/integrase n=1 Tax=Magnetovibrio sp. PR-2 TaxID=3120356 RepID=UPI002FCE49E1